MVYNLRRATCVGPRSGGGRRSTRKRKVDNVNHTHTCIRILACCCGCGGCGRIVIVAAYGSNSNYRNRVLGRVLQVGERNRCAGYALRQLAASHLVALGIRYRLPRNGNGRAVNRRCYDRGCESSQCFVATRALQSVQVDWQVVGIRGRWIVAESI